MELKDESTRPYHLSEDELAVWDPEDRVYITAEAARRRAQRSLPSYAVIGNGLYVRVGVAARRRVRR